MSEGLVLHPDGKARCWWGASSPEYVAYHDSEWGWPVADDRSGRPRSMRPATASQVTRFERSRAACPEDRPTAALLEAVLGATTDLPVPATLLWATRGMQGEVPGLYDEVRLSRLGLADVHVTAREVPGTDHWSVLWAPQGVAAVTTAVRAAAGVS